MTNPTPAVQRAGEALREAAYDGTADGGDFYITDARTALTAALNDPDDPDVLAFTLYALNAMGVPGRSLEVDRGEWDEAPRFIREHWRMVADGLQSTLFGGGA